MKFVALTLPALAVLAAAPQALAQQTTKNVAVTPTPFTAGGNNLPFSAVSGRYAQWYSPTFFTPTVKQPVRIRALQFMADSGTHRGTASLDLQVAMANSNFLSGNFPTSNELTTVLPRSTVTLQPISPGAWTLTINFTTEFIWDGRSGIVVDIRQWSNGSNTALKYNFRSTSVSKRFIQRVWANGKPNATTGTWQDGVGLYTNFFYQEGGSYSFGQGCPGAGNIVPVASSNRVPLAGDKGWQLLLTKTSGRRPAFIMVGLSNTKWSGGNLPFDLGIFSWKNCNLLVDPLVILGVQTAGGGAGSGTAVFPAPIPSVGSLAGAQFYTQWAVFDPGSANGQMSVSNGLWNIIGS